MIKDKFIKIRVSKEEYELFKYFSKINKMTLTDYIKTKCLGYKISYKKKGTL